MNNQYTNLDQLPWQSLSGNNVNNIHESIRNLISMYIDRGANKNNIQLITACDSQRRGSCVVYVTTIILLNKGHGGNVFYVKEIEDYSASLKLELSNKQEKRQKIKVLMQKRLWNETLKAVNCAMWLDDTLYKDIDLKVSEVHVDVNTNKKFKSSELCKSIMGYIDSCGFTPKAKPDAWGASGIANYKTK